VVARFYWISIRQSRSCQKLTCTNWPFDNAVVGHNLTNREFGGGHGAAILRAQCGSVNETTESTSVLA
jgi:hypothetical protein